MKRTALASVALLATLSLAGCSAAGMSDSMGAVDGGGPVPQGGAPAVSEEGLVDGDFATGAERQVITTGWATITVDDPIAAATEAVAITERAGGHVQSQQQYAAVDGGTGSATLSLRIPSDALTDTIAALGELGEVREVSTTEQDVTTQVVDLEARITALTASVDRLVDLLATADTTSTLLEIETTLSSRQAELESLVAQKRTLDDQVALSTISVELVSVADTPLDEPDTFLSGLETGWNAFVGFLAGTLVLLGVLLPWLVFLALVGAVVLVMVRRRRRARAEQPTT